MTITIQIAAAGSRIYALRDDGSIWVNDITTDIGFVKLSDVPER